MFAKVVDDDLDQQPIGAPLEADRVWHYAMPCDQAEDSEQYLRTDFGFNTEVAQLIARGFGM